MSEGMISHIKIPLHLLAFRVLLVGFLVLASYDGVDSCQIGDRRTYEDDKRFFYECTENGAYWKLQRCGLIQKFDSVTKACRSIGSIHLKGNDFIQVNNEISNNVDQVVEVPKPGEDCSNQRLWRYCDYDNCKRYLQCQKVGRRKIWKSVRCLVEGTIFDAETLSCRPASTAHCCVSPAAATEQSPTTPARPNTTSTLPPTAHSTTIAYTTSTIRTTMPTSTTSRTTMPPTTTTPYTTSTISTTTNGNTSRTTMPTSTTSRTTMPTSTTSRTTMPTSTTSRTTMTPPPTFPPTTIPPICVEGSKKGIYHDCHHYEMCLNGVYVMEKCSWYQEFDCDKLECEISLLATCC